MGCLKWFLLPTVLLFLNACLLLGAAKRFPEQSGVVLDKNTHAPIEGAIVVARWLGYISQLVDTQSTCYHVESAVTDAEGRYVLSAWTKLPSKVHHEEIALTIYKAGYIEDIAGVEVMAGKFHERAAPEVIFLIKDPSSDEKRLENIIRHSVSCYGAGKKGKNELLVLYKSLYEEAISLNLSKDKDLKLVTSLLRQVEEVTLGYKEAQKRYYERIKRK